MPIFSRRTSTSSSHTNVDDFIDEEQELEDFPMAPGPDEPPPSPSGRPRSSERNRIGDDESQVFTKGHPLGKILLNVMSRYNELCRRMNFEVDPMDGLCNEFKKAMVYERSVNQTNVAADLSNLEQVILKKELSSYDATQPVQAPTIFSPTPTLSPGGTSRTAELYRLFPLRSGQKFSGTNSNQNILEFLENICHAQKTLNLSRKEFEENFLKSFTGKAYFIVSDHLQYGHGLEDIFHTLIKTFDTRLPSSVAKTKLLTWKIPKFFNLKKAETYVMHLASRIAAELPRGESRSALYNMEAVDGLIRALPTHSQAIALNLKNTLSSRLMRLPTFVELSKALAKYDTTFTEDIRKNGDSRSDRKHYLPFIKDNSVITKDMNNNYAISSNYNGRRTNSGYMNQRNNFPRKSFPNGNNYSSTNLIRSRPRSAPRRNFSRPPNRKNRRFPVRPRRRVNNVTVNVMHQKTPNSKSDYKIGSKKYCSLCGGNNHNAVDICYKMRSPNGENVFVAPSAQPCPFCTSKFGEELFHPESFCWRKNKKITPKNKQ